MVQLHMGYISAFSHHQSMSDPVRIHSGAESGHNLFCLRFPTVRPIQMGKGILHLWLLYCRSSVLLCHDHDNVLHHPWDQESSASQDRISSSTRTIQGLYPVHRRIQVPSAQIHVYGKWNYPVWSHYGKIYQSVQYQMESFYGKFSGHFWSLQRYPVLFLVLNKLYFLRLPLHPGKFWTSG